MAKCKKTPYNTYKEAERAMKALKGGGKESLYVYDCNNCGKFHLSSMNYTEWMNKKLDSMQTIKEEEPEAQVQSEYDVMNDEVSKYWINFYIDYTEPFGLCSLCGNTGVIDTSVTAISPTGLNVGRKNYCICPNGQHLRKDRKEL